MGINVKILQFATMVSDFFKGPRKENNGVTITCYSKQGSSVYETKINYAEYVLCVAYFVFDC